MPKAIVRHTRERRTTMTMESKGKQAYLSRHASARLKKKKKKPKKCSLCVSISPHRLLCVIVAHQHTLLQKCTDTRCKKSEGNNRQKKTLTRPMSENPLLPEVYRLFSLLCMTCMCMILKLSPRTHSPFAVKHSASHSRCRVTVSPPFATARTPQRTHCGINE